MSLNSKQLDEIASGQLVPGATYRLQFNRDFTFAQAAEAAAYLRDLGITDLYASPLFQAAPESTHGYDICSFEQLNPCLGSPGDFDTLCARLRELGLGLILDMVPNHMGNDLTNRWWTNVLEQGRASPFASYFDIDWQPLNSDLHDQVLLPTLEDHYARVLESGKLQLVYLEGLFAIAYYNRKFPVAARCYAALLDEIADAMGNGGEGGVLTKDVRGLVREMRQPAEPLAADTACLQERVRNWDQTSPVFREAVAAVCRAYNGEPGKPSSFDKLHQLLNQQHYRLAFWRVGPEEINYRRFFDVTQLVSVRMELPEVFQSCHRFVFELLKNRQITGLRIDHPDGLWDPKGYFLQLQAGYIHVLLDTDATEAGTDFAVRDWLAQRLAPLEQQAMREPIQPGLAHTGDAPRSDPCVAKAPRAAWPLYVVAEKILSGDEPLRPDWTVEGTTGYEFLNQVNGLFVDQANEQDFDALYHRFTGSWLGFHDTVYLSKHRILDRSLVSELNALAHRLKRLALQTRYGQDFSFRQLHTALTEIIATFPVYRTYVRHETSEVVPRERSYIEQAIAAAKSRNRHLETALFDFIQDLLLLRAPPDFDEEATRLHREFISRFQQLTGPVTAKGLEDTAFYSYNRLISLNEVGGDAKRFGVSVDAFHQHNLHQSERWPHALLATATHDTKRGEDVRSRINVLSEMPKDWQAAIERWSEFNAAKKTQLDGHRAPHPNDEYLLYQTLVGAWPFHGSVLAQEDSSGLPVFRDRVSAYMIKALREAKVQTNWTDPNTRYEEATTRFVEKILDLDISGQFLADFESFQRKAAFVGQFNSLSQLLLKITSPGVPDFYQGTELWDLSLVDPDNRRPVDFAVRRRLLDDLRKRDDQDSLLAELLSNSHTGQLKLHVITRALALRKRHQGLFSSGDYLPINAVGAFKDHICAFARILDRDVVVTVVPRLIYGLLNGDEQLPLGRAVWHDTALEASSPSLAGVYDNVLTGEKVSLSQSQGGCHLLASAALNAFPVALLARSSAPKGPA